MVAFSKIMDDNDIETSWIQSSSGQKFFASESTKRKKRNRKKKRYRLSLLVKDYSRTKWGLIYNDPQVYDPKSTLGKLFRKRFRVPIAVFNIILKQCEDYQLFNNSSNVNKKDRKKRIPTYIKLMICLSKKRC